MPTDAVLNKALISLYRMRNNAPDAIRGLPRTHAGKSWREVAATLSPQDAVWLLRCCNPGLPVDACRDIATRLLRLVVGKLTGDNVPIGFGYGAASLAVEVYFRHPDDPRSREAAGILVERAYYVGRNRRQNGTPDWCASMTACLKALFSVPESLADADPVSYSKRMGLAVTTYLKAFPDEAHILTDLILGELHVLRDD